MLGWKAQAGLSSTPESSLNFPLANGKCLLATESSLEAKAHIFSLQPLLHLSLHPIYFNHIFLLDLSSKDRNGPRGGWEGSDRCG